MLHDLADELNAGIIMLTESHLTGQIRDAEVKINGFDIYRTDRSNFRNGGVITYVKSSLNLGTKLLYSLSHNKIEMLVIECFNINSILACIYRPPSADSSSFNFILSELGRVLNENEGERKTIIVAGDFNFPIIDWKTRKVSGGTREQNGQAEDLLALSEEFFLVQCIEEPTRLNNILDLFFTNNEDMILKTHVEAPSTLSDHRLQCITTRLGSTMDELNVELPEHSFHSLNFTDNTIDWNKINSKIMDVDWDTHFTEKSATQIYSVLTQTLLDICVEEVPEKMPKLKASIPRDRRNLMRKRRRLRMKVVKIAECCND